MTAHGLIEATGERVCSSCRVSKPLSAFYRSSTHSTGYQTSCKDCQRSRPATTTKLQMRQRYERVMVVQPEVERAKHRAARSRRRARLRGGDVRVILERDWRRLVARYGGRCAYCREHPATQQDHIIPIDRGGRHAIGNVLPACRSCNYAKKTKLPVEFRVWLARRAA